jgi:ATP-binding cassette subfamily B protein
VDANVEARIHDALRSAMAGRTTLLIAHRQSTLALADQIAVLDEGRLVDQGTHEELTARCPLYRLLLAGTAGPDDGKVPDQSDGAEVVTSALWGGRRSRPQRAASTVGSARSGPQRAASTATTANPAAGPRGDQGA